MEACQLTLELFCPRLDLTGVIYGVSAPREEDKILPHAPSLLCISEGDHCPQQLNDFSKRVSDQQASLYILTKVEACQLTLELDSLRLSLTGIIYRGHQHLKGKTKISDTRPLYCAFLVEIIVPSGYTR